MRENEDQMPEGRLYNPVFCILSRAALGTAFGLAVGIGVAGICLFLLFFDAAIHPMEPWETMQALGDGKKVLMLAAVAGGVVGSLAGLASGAFRHGLSLLKSTMIVTGAGIAAIAIFNPYAHVKDGMFFLAPLSGVLIGAVIAALVGMARTRKTQYREMITDR
jgi:hypothetical protein